MAKLEKKDILSERSEPRYHMGKSPKGTEGIIICKKCQAVYYKKAWHNDLSLFQLYKNREKTKYTLCPACKKIQQGFIEGIIIIEGKFLKEHQKELLALSKNLEEKSTLNNPLNKIVDIEKGKDKIIIYTAQINLAKSIAKAIKSAFKARMEIKWSHKNKLVYINIRRE